MFRRERLSMRGRSRPTGLWLRAGSVVICMVVVGLALRAGFGARAAEQSPRRDDQASRWALKVGVEDDHWCVNVVQGSAGAGGCAPVGADLPEIHRSILQPDHFVDGIASSSARRIILLPERGEAIEARQRRATHAGSSFIGFAGRVDPRAGGVQVRIEYQDGSTTTHDATRAPGR